VERRLAQAVDFDREKMCANIQSVRPGMPVFEVSARTGLGMEQLIEFLQLCRARFGISKEGMNAKPEKAASVS
jgi:GTPase